MSAEPAVDPEILRLTPLADARAARRLRDLSQHPAAPIWTFEAGDRIEAGDLEAISRFEDALRSRRGELAADAPSAPPSRILAWLEALRDRVPLFRARIPQGLDLERSFLEISTSSREDLGTRPELLVPDDAALDRLIVYRTAGTTGHALLVPHHPRAASSYLPLIRIALERWGARVPSADDDVGVINVGAQQRTVTYPCTLSVWGGTGFAKINLNASEWRAAGDPERFMTELAPPLLTGDPISFSEAMRLGIRPRCGALLTTAVALGDSLRERLRAHFGAPVIDWYSLTETGPIAYACPREQGHHLLAHDLYVEVLDERGLPVGPDQRGEVTVTGGRNPFVPLLRYRTGDFGRIERGPCACGEVTPRLVALEGRAPVVLRAGGGRLVNTVDVARALRAFPLVQHELVQRADRSIELAIRALPGSVDVEAVRAALEPLFGGAPIEVRLDASLGERTGKVVSYRTELRFEE